ncbi:hypothetical protein PI125_g23438 [Phytophthora idaei]|nr:hypothetical protein PI125_g23438 [Phytophthora idaei]KAG3128413.1 hypothetical protein PI126_g21413 [Phytophthora idaei]
MYSELDRILSQTAATGSFAVYNEEVVGRSRSAASSLSEFSDSDDGDETEDRSSIAEEDAVGHTGQRRHSLNFTDHEFKAKDASEDRAAIDQRGVVCRQSVVGRGTPTKRQKTTGEKISESMRVMAEAQESIAVSILTRHNKGRQLSCSDEAIKVFKNMFTDKIPVDQRFRFIKLLAPEPNAATMFYGMDDESREYMVRQYLLADNSDSDDN